jgi:hypothetical protein
MLKWLKTLDQILRGEATRPEAIQAGKFELPLGGLLVVILSLAMVYGVCMGSFSLFKDVDPAKIPAADRYLQVVASTVKVPTLFFLTLLITFPSLYVFNALVGSRLNMATLMRLLVAALAVNVAVLASLGPIVAFFSVSTTSYRFMQLFNVVIFGFAGLLGLLFLMQTLNRMSQRSGVQDATERMRGTNSVDRAEQGGSGAEDPPTAPPDESESAFVEAMVVQRPGALDRVDGHVLGQHVKTVFRLWVVVFGLVGAQMGWVLRPFIGNPDMRFTWFRARESNFFEAVLDIISRLFTGG